MSARSAAEERNLNPRDGGASAPYDRRVSGESTDNSREPRDEAPVEPVAPTDAASAVVPAFDVPEPQTVDVPDAESAAADFDVPPPPTFDSAPPVPAASASPSDDSASPRPSVDEKLTRAALREAAVADAHRPSVAPPAAPTDTGYRAWTIAIFVVLAVLLVGAIVLLVVLINTAPLPFLAAAVPPFPTAALL